MKHLSTYGWRVIYHLCGMPAVVLVAVAARQFEQKRRVKERGRVPPGAR